VRFAQHHTVYASGQRKEQRCAMCDSLAALPPHSALCSMSCVPPALTLAVIACAQPWR
jgi:hypothetical protein